MNLAQLACLMKLYVEVKIALLRAAVNTMKLSLRC